MPTYRLLIEYEGTRYSGWQAQANTSKTVQGHLLRTARQLFDDVEIGGAGRTDAGVHAAGQVAHLRAGGRIHPAELARKLNDLLPHDIGILRADEVSDRFHARHDAESRIYLYQISRRRTAFGKNFVWWVKDRLELEPMQRAVSLLPGMHDFARFTDRRLQKESTRVVVDRVELDASEELILFRIGASHFLWKMVRKIVAALVEVGRGNLSNDDVAAMLSGSAKAMEQTAPPSGLFLEAILYAGEEHRRPLEPIVPVHPIRESRGSS